MTQTWNTRATLTTLVTVITLLAACAGETTRRMDAGDATSASGTIGAEGGEVKLPSGVGVTIPPGALEDDTTIGVELVDDLPALPMGYLASGDAVAFTPGQVDLAEPVTLTLPYSGNGTVVFRLDGPLDTTWEQVTGASFMNGIATLEVDQLGIYVVARRSGSTIILGEDAGQDASMMDANVMDATVDANTTDANATQPDSAVPDANDLDAGALDADMVDAGGDAATSVEVLDVDFEATVPDNVDVGGGVLTPAQGFSALGFGDTFLRGPTGNTITITFSDLPEHNAISIDFLFAAIDSLDGTGSFPAGDFFRVQLDGVTIFRESFANATPSQIQTYVAPPGVELARHVDLGFQGPGSYYTDSAYDFGNDPFFDDVPHTSSTATLTFTLEGEGVQPLDDESWAIDNLRVTARTITTPVSTCSPLGSDFSSSIDGWTQSGVSVFEQRTTGGNPGGMLYVDTSDEVTSYVHAGAQYLGDQRVFNGGTLRFDGSMLGNGGGAYSRMSQDYGWVRISAGTEYAEVDLLPGESTPPLGSWARYSVPLTAEAWGKTPAQWRALLSNVTEIRICVESLSGAEIQALDNIALRCPEPELIQD